MQQHGFGLVVFGVGHADRRCASFEGQPGERVIADPPGSRFDSAGSAFGFDSGVCLHDVERRAGLLREADSALAKLAANLLGLYEMVNMSGADTPSVTALRVGQQQEHRRGIGATRHRSNQWTPEAGSNLLHERA